MMRACESCALSCCWVARHGGSGTGFGGRTEQESRRAQGCPRSSDRERISVWRMELPPGHSSPVIGGGRIYLTGGRARSALHVLPGTGSGRILWKREAPRSRREKLHSLNNPASPTPVTDSENVYVVLSRFRTVELHTRRQGTVAAAVGPFQECLWDRRFAGSGRRRGGAGDRSGQELVHRGGGPERRQGSLAKAPAGSAERSFDSGGGQAFRRDRR